MVQADLAGYEVTGEVRYLRHAWRSLEWFYGRNVRGLSLYDPETGGCFDALMEQQASLLESNPQTSFVSAHVASASEDLKLVSILLDRYSNLSVDISARISVDSKYRSISTLGDLPMSCSERPRSVQRLRPALIMAISA